MVRALHKVVYHATAAVVEELDAQDLTTNVLRVAGPPGSHRSDAQGDAGAHGGRYLGGGEESHTRGEVCTHTHCRLAPVACGHT